jgi:hypothetical protein
MVKVTVPVGVPWNPCAVTTAVKVTCWPTVDGLDDEDTVVTDADAGSDGDPLALENEDVSPFGSVAVTV